MTLTKTLIEACESLEHTYTSETLRALGVLDENAIFPEVGWKNRLTGTQISERAYQSALDARSLAFFQKREEDKQTVMF